MFTNDNYRQLAAAIALQAVKDYFETTRRGKHNILKDLRSEYMVQITNGESLIVAERLESHPEEIAARVRHYNDEIF